MIKLSFQICWKETFINFGLRLFNRRLKAREMRLLDAIDCFSNFNSHLENALIWLVGIDNTLNKFHSSVKTSSRDPIMIKYQEENYQNLRKEIQDHESIMSQIIKAGNRVNPDLNEDEEKVLKDKIVKLQDDWARLQEDIIDIGVIIEEHCRQWNELQSNLRKLNEWLLQVNDELAAEEPLKGDLHALQQQNENLLDIRSRLATHQPLVEETLESGSLYAKSQDDRTQEDQYGDIDQQPMVELKGLLALLGDRWNSVSKRADDWQTLLDKTILEFNELTSLMREAVSQLLSCEKKRLSWVSPRDINSENLSSQLQDLKSFRESIQKNRPNIENIKRLYFSIGKKGITLNRVIIDQYSDINRRWADLTRSEQIRIDELKEFRDTTTEVSHHQSEVTSKPPWEKSLTVNNVPYYVNHEKKVTQWDHPQMTEIYDLLVNNNFIKYAAYRTAMKLRKLQKCLFLNFIELNSLKTAFQDSGLRFKNDAYIDINDIYKLLNIVYERINNKKFSRKKIPLYKDLVVNWLLNVYDVPRTGKIRILSLRIGLVILCNAPLEEKYRYMFNLIARHDGCTDKARLGLFLHDCLQIPRQLGEVAAFGGSNIEPSIRSCLETGNSEEFVGSVQFLDWMLAEPQSMVWLPVMHRISAAENVSHQTRCSVCKTAAFKGLRYRCLECFNFDMCQACFFKGETCKGHKSSHQMQEYCLESSTGDDAKDFFKFVRNKLKTKSMRRRSRKLGYLPLQSVVEGDSVESRRSSKNRSSIETDRPLLAMAEDEEELSAEAVRLKEDKNRLEKKMAKLEIYNKQLEGQLKLLKNSINETVSFDCRKLLNSANESILPIV
ncbi:uncharacterized protein TRIADDRAFT_30356 [Trichoplax adhaerens]|uniref:Dystrophin n=1 Tax=Trichoplax adhaerens TaxID=10228 RepID=B3S724_TRIAD|nr:hypothetical protein TRIADDRAFT_30356 [Trichoplax adhaerens]EDV21493.1 hypothetical protein TRIADDRAFT_30356 [Trichoplax adhaerens]|eukprot:XP_002116093.1 hypothetical protein TRIADDRAFT_30356 [Trichoplax adhaerens]